MTLILKEIEDYITSNPYQNCPSNLIDKIKDCKNEFKSAPGDTFLHFAISNNQVGVVEELLKHKFLDINKKVAGKSPLELAASSEALPFNPRRQNIIKVLLAAGADPKDLIASAYQANAKTLHKMIELHEKNKERRKPVPQSEIKVIYNNDEYSDNKNFPKNYQQGSPLALEDNTPIGYNIHLPKGKVEHVMVRVYAGLHAGSPIINPGELKEEEKVLINKGIAVVTLNLNDLLQGGGDQHRMNTPFHNQLHESINKFYQTIRNDPTKIHPSLASLSNAKLFLNGASFGGRTAVRHAELYPKTFDGYISHDGILDYAKAKDAGNFSVNFNKDLDPADPDNLKNLVDPVLILHNLDDVNVSAKVAFSLIEKARKAGKADLVALSHTKVGAGTGIYKGHFVTDSQKSFEKYCNSIIHFIKEGPASLTAKTQLNNFYQKKLANKFYLLATPKKLFIAEALETYKKRNHSAESIKNDKIWKEHYQDSLNAYCFVDLLTNDPVALEAEIERLKNGLTDESLSKVLEKKIPNYLKFLEDTLNLKIDPSLNKETLSNNNDFRNHLKGMILSFNPADLKNSIERRVLINILSELYQNSPDLLPNNVLQSADFISKKEEFTNKLESTIVEYNKRYFAANKPHHMRPIRESVSLDKEKLTPHQEESFKHRSKSITTQENIALSNTNLNKNQTLDSILKNLNINDLYQTKATEKGFIKKRLQVLNIKIGHTHKKSRKNQIAYLNNVIESLTKGNDRNIPDKDKLEKMKNALHHIESEISKEKNTFKSRLSSICKDLLRDLDSIDGNANKNIKRKK